MNYCLFGVVHIIYNHILNHILDYIDIKKGRLGLTKSMCRIHTFKDSIFFELYNKKGKLLSMSPKTPEKKSHFCVSENELRNNAIRYEYG